MKASHVFFAVAATALHLATASPAAAAQRSPSEDLGHFSERFRKTNAHRGPLVTDGTTLYSGDHRLDGETWARLGDGIATYVEAAILIGTDLIVSGYSRAGSPLVAKWNGAHWTTLADDGLRGSAPRLAALGDDLIVAGYFETIEGVPAYCPLFACDVDGSYTVTAADSLRVLRAAVGLPFEGNCPASWDGD